MADELDMTAARVVAAFADTGAHFRTGVWLVGGVGALAVIVGAARGLPWLAAIAAVLFGAHRRAAPRHRAQSTATRRRRRCCRRSCTSPRG